MCQQLASVLLCVTLCLSIEPAQQMPSDDKIISIEPAEQMPTDDRTDQNHTDRSRSQHLLARLSVYDSIKHTQHISTHDLSIT